MLDPASAIGLAASVVQLISFIKSVLDDSHELYKSASGALVRNSELEAACTRLHRLMKALNRAQKGSTGTARFLDEANEFDDESDQELAPDDNQETSIDVNSKVTNENSATTSSYGIDGQLKELSVSTTNLAKVLLQKLRRLKIHHGDGKWKSFRKAVTSVLESRELEALEDRLDRNRKQIDTALLISLRYITFNKSCLSKDLHVC